MAISWKRIAIGDPLVTVFLRNFQIFYFNLQLEVGARRTYRLIAIQYRYFLYCSDFVHRNYIC